MSHSHSRIGLALFFNHFAPLMFLIGPLLYFYVRGTIKDQYSLSKKDSIHFIPAAIAFVGTIPYYFQSFEKKLQIADSVIENVNNINQIEVNLFYTIGGSFAFRSLLSFGYTLYCFYLILKNSPTKNGEIQVPIKQFRTTQRWLLILLSSMLVVNISLTINAIQATTFMVRQNFFVDGSVFYQITGITYFVLTVSLLMFPQILYGMPKKMEQTAAKNKKIKNKIIPDEDPFIDISESIIDYLNNKKPYLNPNFAISDIAFDLKIPQNHVSYCISNIMNTRFSKLKSELRIQQAIDLLKNGHQSSITIDGIGTQSGFKTRSHYYEVFKKETGCTPSEYLENIKKTNKL